MYHIKEKVKRTDISGIDDIYWKKCDIALKDYTKLEENDVTRWLLH